MKYTGIIRRIDSLGRIVIPKEIRNKLKIKEEEAFEFCFEDDYIVLRKYSKMSNYEKNINFYGKLLHEITSLNVIITSLEKVIFSSEKNKNILSKEISENLYNKILLRKNIEDIRLEIIVNVEIENYYLVPLISESNLIGSIIVYKNKLTNENKIVTNVLSKVLIESIEEGK